MLLADQQGGAKNQHDKGGENLHKQGHLAEDKLSPAGEYFVEIRPFHTIQKRKVRWVFRRNTHSFISGHTCSLSKYFVEIRPFHFHAKAVDMEYFDEIPNIQ